MDILIFDMDGVLLEAKGYHRALQDTIKLVGEYLSLQNIELTQEQINKFEAFGISSEWHSSALCMAFLQIQLLSGISSPVLDLEEIFYILEEQPLEQPAIERGLAAIEILCQNRGANPEAVRSIITDSADIDRSLTMQWFQELVLGSESFQTHYQKPGMNSTQSYLGLFDIPIVTSKNAELIKQWEKSEGCGAAVMTNRPSSGPSGFSGSPEAELGLELVQLSGIPLVGFGEISWLATQIQTTPGALVKPDARHALAAVFSSIRFDKKKSLEYSILDPSQWPGKILENLQGGTISVFEDTPVGVVAIQSAAKILFNAGIDIETRVYGITKEKSKKAALEAQGAQVFPDVNLALSDIEHFRSFASD